MEQNKELELEYLVTRAWHNHGASTNAEAAKSVIKALRDEGHLPAKVISLDEIEKLTVEILQISSDTYASEKAVKILTLLREGRHV